MSSRRIFLKEENGKVTGFNSMGGDFFEAKNYFVEQNTLWQEKRNKEKTIDYVPKKIPKNRQLWIEFANTFMETTLAGSKIHQPGLVLWVQRLRSEDLLREEKIIEFATVSAYYDSNNSSIVDITGDTLSIHTSLLETLNEVWRKRISEEIDKCAKLAEFVGELSENITLASYRNIESQGANESRKKKRNKSQYYEKGEELTYLSINEPFKRWIESLDPKLNNYDYFALEWHKTIRKIAKAIENELCNGLPIEGYIGRKIVDKNVEGKIMSVPIAQRIYWSKVNKLYTGKEG
jgi:CRISPR system Cascade subunit CasA